MKDALKFVKGAVGKKDFVPALKHVNINNGVIQSFNGSIALSSPINFKHNVAPRALEFIRAVEKCGDEPQISITKAQRLKVASGSFKVFINLLDTVYPSVEPEGEIYDCELDLIEALTALAPFISKDASRPWSRGIIIRNGYAYATNNVALVCYTKPVKFPCDIIIPKECVDELLRIRQPVRTVQMNNNSVTFHFDNDRWLRTNLIDSNAPDFYPVLGKCDYNSVTPIQEDLGEKLERIKSFSDSKEPVITLKSDGMFTSQIEGEGAHDSEYSFPLAVFRYEPLALVLSVATHWNLSYYPQACPFTGPNISGVIIGMRT